MKMILEFDDQSDLDKYIESCKTKIQYVAELEADNNALKHRIQSLNEQIEGARKAVLEKTTSITATDVRRHSAEQNVSSAEALNELKSGKPTTVIPQISDVPPAQEPAVDLRAMFGGAVVPTAAEIAAITAIPTSAASSAVPAPPPTIVPSPVAAAAHINPIAPELDVDGLPWDARIHSNPKKKNADNTWRAKRGVDKALVARVTSEYRQLMAIPMNGDTRTLPLLPQPAMTAAQALPTLPTIPNVPALPVQPVIAAPPAASSAPVPPPSSPKPANVQDLILAITGRIAAKTMTQEQVTAALAKYSIPAIPLLAMRPDLIPIITQELGL